MSDKRKQDSLEQSNPSPGKKPINEEKGREPHNIENRLIDAMEHLTAFSFRGPSRLAAAAGISRAALSRLINGHSSPSYKLVCALTAAVERELSTHIDPRELVAPNGEFLTASLCSLMGCRGCLPSAAYDRDDNLKPEYRHLNSSKCCAPDIAPQPDSDKPTSPQSTPAQGDRKGEHA